MTNRILRGMTPITGFVPYIHVRDVLASQAFYERFGLVLDSRFGEDGAPYWARMKAPNCDLMLASCDAPVDPRTQGALFYLYHPDVAAFRSQLLEAGLADGGAYSGATEDDFPRSGKVFAVQNPFYMPEGEIRVHDPDGYVLLVGQLG